MSPNPQSGSASERAIFRQWADTGAQEGQPTDLSSDSSDADDSFESDMVIRMAEPYELTDDYRCFVIEPGLSPEDEWIIQRRSRQ